MAHTTIYTVLDPVNTVAPVRLAMTVKPSEYGMDVHYAEPSAHDFTGELIQYPKGTTEADAVRKTLVAIGRLYPDDVVMLITQKATARQCLQYAFRESIACHYVYIMTINH